MNQNNSDSSIVYLIDSREKLPLSIPNSKKTYLEYGDYSIKGLENIVSVERKSIQDWVSSITGQNRKNFENRIERAIKKLKFYAIVIDGSYSELGDSKNWFGDTKASSVKGTATKWIVKYSIPIIFSDSRENSSEIIQSLLKGYLYYHKEILI